MIYCGYQGCGKSTYCRSHPDTTVDLDSSGFIKRDGWEAEYVKTAQIISDSGKKVFISAHQVVINYLLSNDIPFELLIPEQDPAAWRDRLFFRYHLNPSRGNLNAILDFDANYHKDMAFYATLSVVKHFISARIVTNIGDFV